MTITMFQLNLTDDKPTPLTMSDLTDSELIKLNQNGTKNKSNAALSELYKRYHHDVRRFANSKLHNNDITDDIFGQVWATVTTKIRTYELTGAPFKSWLFSITHNKIREYTRENSSISYEQLQEQQSSALAYIAVHIHQLDRTVTPQITPSQAIKHQADKLLQAAISELSELQQTIILLMYYEGIENATVIGKRLNIKPGTVRANHRRAKKYLEKSAVLQDLFKQVK